MSKETKSIKPWPLLLLLLNAIGATGYVLLASHAWVIPEECAAGIHVTTGEPFVWFTEIAPVIGIFFCLDLAWGAMILIRHQWSTSRMWLVTAAIWIIAASIDFSHHQC
jgi:hypothetical protein